MEVNTRFKIITASGIPILDNQLSRIENFDVSVCDIREQLSALIEKELPQIVIISDKISGEENIVKMILSLKKKYHYIRFIYLAGSIDARDTARVDTLGMLVLVGIYDIVISKKINIDLVLDIIKNPLKEQTVAYLTNNLLDEKHEIINAMNGLEYEVFCESSEDDFSFPNLFTFASIKPGTGKSFLSSNVACAIAKYGRNRPKVALIEADMQTLSLGTLLSIDEKKGNLKNVISAISGIFNNGVLTDDEEKKRKVNKIIKNNMVSYKDLSNLQVLVGSSITPEEIDRLELAPSYFTYIIDVLKDEYDYILVDTNSSIFHVSSFPILQKASKCFYILNLDFNNIRNNIRYVNVLKDIGLLSKIQYILNENIENTKEYYDQGVDTEELNFTAENIEEKYFKLIAKIPVLKKTVFLNRLYEGTPVVLDKNSIEYTNKAKYEIMKISNQICEMDDEFNKLEKIINQETKKKFSFPFFNKKEIKTDGK